MAVVLSLEAVNISFMLTNATISDIIKDFIALLIISDFDDYFFLTVSHTPAGRLVKDGELETSSGTLSLKDILKIETTTSTRAPGDEKIPHTFKYDKAKEPVNPIAAIGSLFQGLMRANQPQQPAA